MKCAFCPSPAVAHGGEHAWSDWMNKLITGKLFRFASFTETGEIRTWRKRKLDAKLPVVCEPCNNGWMSDLENKDAKPAIKDLIVSDKIVKLSPERLKSIARFAFKTAVVADHYSLSGHTQRVCARGKCGGSKLARANPSICGKDRLYTHTSGHRNEP
jgi:hypothetical protein